MTNKFKNLYPYHSPTFPIFHYSFSLPFSYFTIQFFNPSHISLFIFSTLLIFHYSFFSTLFMFHYSFSPSLTSFILIIPHPSHFLFSPLFSSFTIHFPHPSNFHYKFPHPSYSLLIFPIPHIFHSHFSPPF